MSEHQHKSSIVFEDISGAAQIPSVTSIDQWVQQALASEPNREPFLQVGIQIVDEKTISELNEVYRHKSGTTNVLAFPFQALPGLPEEEANSWLGDIVICAQVLANEAHQQNKHLQAHWAHIVVHGMLHLLGYDHLNDKEAKSMESIEIQLLSQLAFSNPYLSNQSS